MLSNLHPLCIAGLFCLVFDDEVITVVFLSHSICLFHSISRGIVNSNSLVWLQFLVHLSFRKEIGLKRFLPKAVIDNTKVKIWHGVNCKRILFVGNYRSAQRSLTRCPNNTSELSPESIVAMETFFLHWRIYGGNYRSAQRSVTRCPNNMSELFPESIVAMETCFLHWCIFATAAVAWYWCQCLKMPFTVITLGRLSD